MAETRVSMTLRDFFFSDPFFKSSWEDFDKAREAMMRESKQFMQMFDKMTSNMGEKQEVQQTEKTLKDENDEHVEKKKEDVNKEKEIEMKQDKDTDSNWLLPRRWMLPVLRTEKDSEVIRVKEDKERLEVSLDTSQYRPDELKVNVDNGMITVEGKHEEKSDDGNKVVFRQFIRSFNLPQGAKPEEVNSNLSSDGVLVITAPKDAKKAVKVKINKAG